MKNTMTSSIYSALSLYLLRGSPIVAVALTVGVYAASVVPVCADGSNGKFQKANTYYKEAQVAMKAGNYNLAKAKLGQVLRIYPSHPEAKRQLIYLQSNSRNLESLRRKSSLSHVLIQKVDIDAATVQESLEVLAVLVNSQVESTGGKGYNFIIQDPAGKFKARSVTLQLERVPADAVLDYILSQADAKVRYDRHAIVVSPQS